MVSQFFFETKKLEDELRKARRTQDQATSSHELPLILGLNLQRENLKSLYRSDANNPQEQPSESSNSAQIQARLETHAFSFGFSRSAHLELQKTLQDEREHYIIEEKNKFSNFSLEALAIKSFKSHNVAQTNLRAKE